VISAVEANREYRQAMLMPKLPLGDFTGGHRIRGHMLLEPYEGTPFILQTCVDPICVDFSKNLANILKKNGWQRTQDTRSVPKCSSTQVGIVVVEYYEDRFKFPAGALDVYLHECNIQTVLLFRIDPRFIPIGHFEGVRIRVGLAVE